MFFDDAWQRDESPVEKVDGFTSGFIGSLKDDVHAQVLSSSAEILGRDETVRLFRCSPFREQTWRLLARRAKEVRDQLLEQCNFGICTANGNGNERTR